MSNEAALFLTEKHRRTSQDGTVKIAWSLSDGRSVESVVLHRQTRAAQLRDAPVSQISAPARLTACVSSQAGCAMGCAFCLTAQQGLLRNLTVQEIVGQVDRLRAEFPITNVVFMGMGEPLHNFDAVTDACRTLMDRSRRPFSRRKILISTSGIVPAIEKLAERAPVRLAVSLNASTDEVRSKLMPVNRKWKIREVLYAAERHAARVKMPTMLEYVLIRNLNDSPEDAERLRVLAADRPFQINLIPFNEFPGSPYARPAFDRVKLFQHHLVSKGVTTTIRFSGGNDILAACGQLSGRQKENTQALVAVPH